MNEIDTHNSITPPGFLRVVSGIALVIMIGALLGMGYFLFVSTPLPDNEPKELFIVPLGMKGPDVVRKLKDTGFIEREWAFNLALFFKGRSEPSPGGYYISKSMSTWGIAGVLRDRPSLRWVTIPEGLRKEEIADILADRLEWTREQRNTWITTDTALEFDRREGVYFPDTYLIPTDESTADVAKRMRARFEEKFAPYAKEALAQNIRWPTVVKIASLIQREAAGKEDMSLISGVIWNRLLRGQRLEIDATLQYARGDKGQDWWAPITPAEKELDSPYNTYKRAGLPPTPIANPGVDALAAAVRPAETKCLFYLHDREGAIHCAPTYAEHQRNIETYLK